MAEDKKLTDSEIVKALEDLVKCNNNEIDCGSCALSIFYPRCPEEIGELSLDLINRQKAENENLQKALENQQKISMDRHFEIERLKNDLAISKKETKRYKESYITAKKESTKNHKELLKSKVFKYVRNPNRIYTIMDFQDGEILRFYDYPERPNALASGYYKFQGKNDIRLLHISEVKELSYEEIKAEAYKECIEKVKENSNKMNLVCSGALVRTDYTITEQKLDNLFKELVGEDK